MSDNFIRFIPADPRFVPTKQAQKAATALLRAAAPRADDISSESDVQVQFRDCGGNFERILCPGCGNEIEVDVWQEWMDRDYSTETGFRLGPVTTPCCRHRTTLNELKYEFPQGFSRYVLTAMNAGLGGEVPASLLAKVARALGCEVRIVYQHL